MSRKEATKLTITTDTNDGEKTEEEMQALCDTKEAWSKDDWKKSLKDLMKRSFNYTGPGENTVKFRQNVKSPANPADAF